MQLDHRKLEAAVKALDTPSTPTLDDVGLLVNTLKHNNSKWGLPLWERRQGTFMPDLNPDAKNINWYESVWIKSDDVEMIWTIIASSGPRTKTVQSRNPPETSRTKRALPSVTDYTCRRRGDLHK